MGSLKSNQDNEDLAVNLGYKLHNLYLAYEGLFKPVARFFENQISDSVKYHIDLLKRMLIEIEGIRRETPLSFINPVCMKTAKHDKTTAEMIRLDVFPGMVGRKIAGVKLNLGQYRTYAKIAVVYRYTKPAGAISGTSQCHLSKTEISD